MPNPAPELDAAAPTADARPRGRPPSAGRPPSDPPMDAAVAAEAAGPPSPMPPPSPAPSPSSPACSVTMPGGSGGDPGGVIPVCCTPDPDERAMIDEVFRLLNEHRQANGRGALVYDEKLGAAIQGHCRHMAQHSFFSHEAPEPPVKAFTTRATLCGTSATGENIALQQRTPADVMTTWIRSAGHNANMLGPSYRRVGICFHQRRWGQIFGR